MKSYKPAKNKTKLAPAMKAKRLWLAKIINIEPSSNVKKCLFSDESAFQQFVI